MKDCCKIQTKIRDENGGLDVAKKIILKWMIEEYGGRGVERIQMARDNALWLTVVNTEINLWVP